MQTINFTTTKFVKPPLINEEEYFIIKNKLNNNHNFNLDSGSVRFMDHFKPEFKRIRNLGIAFILAVILQFIFYGDADQGIFVLVMGISMFMIFIQLIFLLLQGPSYATYLKKRQKYVLTLKECIIKSSSYAEFLEYFTHRK